MLAQFHSRYPTGSLISELLTIYQGKFVVRVVVQIDGVTRASGMAAAETPESAEDKARSRALTAMAIEQTPSSPITTIPNQTAPAAMPEPPLPKVVVPEPVAQNFNPNAGWSATEPVQELYEEAQNPRAPFFAGEAQPYAPPAESDPAIATTSAVKSTNKGFALASNPPETEEDVFGEFGLSSHPQTESTGTQTTTSSNVIPIAPPSYQPQFGIEPQTQTNTSEPVDLSDDFAAIDVQLKELRWKPEIESKFLQRNYSKSSRHELTPEQVQEFRRYLELFSQTDKELRKLSWSNEKGRTYLAQTYNKKSRQELTYEQLQEFLEYLHSEGEQR
ncbi:MAG TPA: hypothetical protein DEV81_14500 [Cyanobacteria bacterium UBA11049]|nr:hypothetical protein [Cyanobacteria bacterium UBA11049]